MQGSLCKGPPTHCRGPYLDYLCPLIRLGPINGLLPKAEAICIAFVCPTVLYNCSWRGAVLS